MRVKDWDLDDGIGTEIIGALIGLIIGAGGTIGYRTEIEKYF